MSAYRRRWLAFLEEGVGFLVLVVVALSRSGSPDRWATFAWLIGAYVVGLLAASAGLEHRLPFGPAPVAIEDPDGIGERGSAGLELLGAAIAFGALTVAFDRGALPPSVAWLGLAVVASAAWTMGHGFAGAVRLAVLARRARHAAGVGQPTTPA